MPKQNKSNENPDPYLQLLAEWEETSLELARLKEIELVQRERLFAGAFPTPREGTNSHTLPDGRVIKGKHTINRVVDEAALPSALDALRKLGVANTDALVRYRPELAKSEWNSLSDDMKLVFSPALIAREGRPQLDVVIPKRRGRA